MGQGGLERFLTEIQAHRRISVDTQCCIYFLTAEMGRYELMRALFLEAARGAVSVEFAGVVQLELLVHPFRHRDRRELERILQLTREFPGAETSEITERVRFAAAEVRALLALKTPDALVVGSAAASGCSAIVGNDRKFRALNSEDEIALTAFGRTPLPLPRYIEIDDFVDETAEPVTQLRKRDP